MSTRNTREKVRKVRQAYASAAHLDSCCREADRLVAEQRRKRDANRRRYFEAYIAYRSKKKHTEKEYYHYRLEESRRGLMALRSKVKAPFRDALSDTLLDAVHKIERLQEEAEKV